MPKFALVRWLSDESVGVMPLTAARKGSKIYVSAVIEMKFQKKFYDAELLKISGRCSK